MALRRRQVYRPRHLTPGDTRSPMERLLTDCNNAVSGTIEVDYDAQWQTLFKAQRLGYVDADQRLTQAGRDFLTTVKGA